ncbi:MAG: O-phosphoserine--tRNA ligase [Methanophagales archaeon ANME-1-THS]|nr:MAG: O-phosphoserine--tRNA ligase [Methanophagales archaeon ANME-1-THS]
MKFDPRQIREELSRDFEATWYQGVKYLGERRLTGRYPRSLRMLSSGKPHPVFETIQKLREAYLRLGFEEVMNPLIIEDEDVKKQFGKEALAVLDRCYYLAGLPRPDIGISEERIQKMNSYLGKDLSNEEIEALKNTLHQYKKGELGGDDLVYAMAKSIHVEDMAVTKVLDTVFPELKSLAPLPSSATLRSHMTSGWFLTLAEIWAKKPLPIKLFSVDRCFRREQREDEIRLRAYHSASCVVCNEGGEASIDDGKDIATGLLSQFGFRKIRFKKDEKRSKYYMPETQTEVFCHHPRLGWVELATFGIYSPTALAPYDIPYPVMNLGLGVERLAMILHEANDVRALSFPQFYAPWELSDIELAELISIEQTPSTPEGEQIAKEIVRVCEEKGNEKSPCEFLAYRGPLFGRAVEVRVIEPEENTRLCGPAYLNELVVFEGSILGIPRKEEWKKVFEEGVLTNMRFLDAFAALAASKLEEAAETGEIDQNECEVKVKIVRSGADINIKLDEVAMRYITSKKKKIDIRGPVFITVVGKKVA